MLAGVRGCAHLDEIGGDLLVASHGGSLPGTGFRQTPSQCEAVKHIIFEVKGSYQRRKLAVENPPEMRLQGVGDGNDDRGNVDP
jgi:hypothetical protein